MPKPLRIAGLLVLLLVAQGFLAYDSLRIKSVTYDELTHLPAGMASVATGDIELNRQHPPLVKWLAGLAATTAAPHLPLDGDAYREGREWHFGSETLFHPHNDHWQILTRGRLPTVLFAMLGALVVFLWARELSSPGGAFFATSLWIFSPSVLAQARWVTMDMAVTSLGLLALFLWWRFSRLPLDSPQSLHAVWCGLALGLTLGAKFSGLVLIPAMALADVLANGLRPDRWRRFLVSRLVAWSIVGATAWLTVWALYLFPADPLVYFRALGGLYADLPPDYRFFLAGDFQEGGFAHYFLATFLLKSTPLELLLAFALPVLLWHRRKSDDLFWLVPAGAWFVATTWLASNQGHRYILMLYPLLFIAGALWFEKARIDRLLNGRSHLWAWLPVLFVLAQAAETLSHHPDYLPYFNRLAGGPEAAPFWLDDSNVDWNQDVGRLAPWLEAKGIDSARTVFMGSTQPEYYGIRREPFRQSDWRDGPRPGAYVISAHVLSRGLELHQYQGFQSDWLRRYRPVDVLGGSLYLYVFPESERPED